MTLQTWGCYSVADHLEPRAFIADLLLYDRLVVPVPAADDVQRWRSQGWDPDRQEKLLDILDTFAVRTEWSAALRQQFAKEWSSQAIIANDIEGENFRASPDNSAATEIELSGF